LLILKVFAVFNEVEKMHLTRDAFFVIFTKKTLKNIIVTGTSRGIGYALALQFGKAGHQVLAISRKTPKELLEHPNITCLSVDLSQENEMVPIEKFLSSTWEKVDAVIHNAGALLLKPIRKHFTAGF